MLVQTAVVIGFALAGVLGTAANVRAQALKDVQTANTPLVLKAQGSFFVGGDKAEQTRVELGDLGPDVVEDGLVESRPPASHLIRQVHGMPLAHEVLVPTHPAVWRGFPRLPQLNGAVLMGHSQSGAFPLAAALLNPTAAKGLVLVEPGGCPGMFSDEQIKTLATIPVLAVFGDHRDTPTGIGIRPSWQLSFESCQTLIGRLKAAGGQAEMLAPADRGIRGNSHKNHLQVADFILQWIDQRVSKRNGAKK